MTFIRACATALPLLVLTGTVGFAEDATPAGAARLTEVFQTYLGKTPGVVAVTPAGAVYDLRLDPAPLLSRLPAEAGTATVTPFVLQLTDNGDGTWGVTQDQPIDLAIRSPGQFDMTMSVASYKSTATFDEALGTFTTSSGDFTDFRMNQTSVAPDPSGTSMANVSYVIASGHVETTGKAGSAGGVDITQKMAMQGLSETISTPMGPGAPPLDITLSADTYDLDGAILGVKPHALMGLAAYFVAHPSELEIKASQEDLRSLLGEAMPLFDHMTASGSITNVVAQTPIGAVTATSLGVDTEANGLVKDGMLRQAMSVEGLVLPPGLVPEWATTLLPQKTQIDVKVSGFDLASPANAMIAAFDVTKPEPLEQSFLDGLLPQFLPNGTVEITLAPGVTEAPAFALGYEGAMTAGPFMAMPTGKAKLSLKGYDAIVAAVSAAPPEVGQQALPAMAMVRGMASMEGETLVWDIDATQPPRLLVNGVDIAPMLGQP